MILSFFFSFLATVCVCSLPMWSLFFSSSDRPYNLLCVFWSVRLMLPRSFQIFHKIDSIRHMMTGAAPPVRVTGPVRDFIMDVRTKPMEVSCVNALYSDLWQISVESGSVQFSSLQGSQVSILMERQTHDWTVASSSPGRNDGRIFFFKVDFPSWLLFSVRCTLLFPLWCVKDTWSCCQKCRW